MALPLIPFSKKDYDKIVSDRRKAFMMEHFSSDLERIFQELRTKAGKMSSCSHAITIRVDDHFDVAKMQTMIIAYFGDLGYIASPLNISGEFELCFLLE